MFRFSFTRLFGLETCASCVIVCTIDCVTIRPLAAIQINQLSISPHHAMGRYSSVKNIACGNAINASQRAVVVISWWRHIGQSRDTRRQSSRQLPWNACPQGVRRLLSASMEVAQTAQTSSSRSRSAAVGFAIARTQIRPA